MTPLVIRMTSQLGVSFSIVFLTIVKTGHYFDQPFKKYCGLKVEFCRPPIPFLKFLLMSKTAERWVSYSGLFIVFVGWHVSALSLPPGLMVVRWC
jgi:hypothetical protein